MGNSASKMDPETRMRYAHGPMVLDFDSIPVLQPSTHRPGESSIDSSQSFSVAFPVVSNEAVMRDSTSSRPIVITQPSPSLSYNASIAGTMSSPEMEFSERRQMSSRRASIASRAWDNDEPIDVGMPPAVPPHRILSGKIVLPPPGYSDGQPSPPLSTSSNHSKDSGNSVNTDIYTRKCSFHHRSASGSPTSQSTTQGRSRASSRASATFPGLEPEQGFDSPTQSDAHEPATPETPSFALEGYQRGSTLLRVINVDSDCSDAEDSEEVKQLKKSRFFVPSKAMLAEQNEKEAAWRQRYKRYGHRLPPRQYVRSAS